MACGGNITCLLLSYTNSEQVSPKKWDQFQSAYDCCERRMEMRSVKDAPNGWSSTHIIQFQQKGRQRGSFSQLGVWPPQSICHAPHSHPSTRGTTRSVSAGIFSYTPQYLAIPDAGEGQQMSRRVRLEAVVIVFSHRPLEITNCWQQLYFAHRQGTPTTVVLYSSFHSCQVGQEDDQTSLSRLNPYMFVWSSCNRILYNNSAASSWTSASSLISRHPIGPGLWRHGTSFLQPKHDWLKKRKNVDGGKWRPPALQIWVYIYIYTYIYIHILSSNMLVVTYQYSQKKMISGKREIER